MFTIVKTIMFIIVKTIMFQTKMGTKWQTNCGRFGRNPEETWVFFSRISWVRDLNNLFVKRNFSGIFFIISL